MFPSRYNKVLIEGSDWCNIHGSRTSSSHEGRRRRQQLRKQLIPTGDLVSFYFLRLTNYIYNSLFLCFQKAAILNSKPLLQQTMVEFYCNSFPNCIRFADMGCSSGPNSLLPTWEAMDSLRKICRSLNRKPPIFQVFLNDLPGNDFNTVVKSLPSFYDRLKTEKGDEFGSCFVSATPGSFYGRLFPPCFLHFVFSSYSLQWLSQVHNLLINLHYPIFVTYTPFSFSFYGFFVFIYFTRYQMG